MRTHVAVVQVCSILERESILLSWSDMRQHEGEKKEDKDVGMEYVDDASTLPLAGQHGHLAQLPCLYSSSSSSSPPSPPPSLEAASLSRFLLTRPARAPP